MSAVVEYFSHCSGDAKVLLLITACVVTLAIFDAVMVAAKWYHSSRIAVRLLEDLEAANWENAPIIPTGGDVTFDDEKKLLIMSVME
ncbi:hypothetical protein H2203_006370 [Taxawa tesnikishii (nom. ined.)]|nr:hypothetical protein H2203_006370 [Dothideales sp. JES 119]